MGIKKLNTNPIFINEDGHLNDEAVALFVDSLLLNTQDQVPEEITLHVEDCIKCKHEITDLYELQKSGDHSFMGAHPYFEKKKSFQWNYFMRIAAMLAIIAGIGYWSLDKLMPKDEIVSGKKVEDDMDSIKIGRAHV